MCILWNVPTENYHKRPRLSYFRIHRTNDHIGIVLLSLKTTEERTLCMMKTHELRANGKQNRSVGWGLYQIFSNFHWWQIFSDRPTLWSLFPRFCLLQCIMFEKHRSLPIRQILFTELRKIGILSLSLFHQTKSSFDCLTCFVSENNMNGGAFHSLMRVDWSGQLPRKKWKRILWHCFHLLPSITWIWSIFLFERILVYKFLCSCSFPIQFQCNNCFSVFIIHITLLSKWNYYWTII